MASTEGPASKAHALPIDESTLAALGLQETVLTLCATRERVVFMRSTFANQDVLRVVSCSRSAFDLEYCAEILEADPVRSTFAVIDRTSEAAQRVADSLLNGITVRIVALSEARPEYQHVIREHLAEHGEFVQEQFGFRMAPALPPRLRRMWERLGDHGFELVAGQSVLASSRAASRVVAHTMLTYRRADPTHPRDSIAQLHLAWNVVAQAFVALENIAAFYESLRATKHGDFKRFAPTFLRFGQTSKAHRRDTIHNTFTRLGGPNGEKDLAETFCVPLHRGHLKEYGLEQCAVDPDKLVAIGKQTATILAERFRRLADWVVFGTAPPPGVSYNPKKSSAKRAYDALHHGFSLALPVLAPYPQSVSLVGGYLDDGDFAEQRRARDFAGDMLVLDESTGSVRRIRGPATVAELKPFAHAVLLATTWLHELTKYTEDKFCSLDGKMPYLINSSLQLLPGEYAELQRCLDQLRDGGKEQ
jgi:hypothetical protein